MSGKPVALLLGLVLFATVLALPAPRGLSPEGQKAGACALLMAALATAANAIVFGSGRIRARDMMKAGILLDLVAAVLIALAMYFLAAPVFDLL